MRSVLLFLLGGVLVWWLWSSIGGGAQVVGADGGAPGAMLPPERSASEDAEPAAKTTETADAGKHVIPPAGTMPQPAAEAGDSSARARNPASPGETSSNPRATPEVPGGTRAAELELARALVSAPQEFAAVAQARADLSATRRSYALALGRALAGADAEARTLLTGLEQAPDVSAADREFLARLIDRPQAGTQLAGLSTAAESPLVRAAMTVVEVRASEAALAAGRSQEAAASFSDLLRGSLSAPWGTDPAVLRRWSEELKLSQQKYRWNRDGRWPSVAIQVIEGDSLISLRKRVLKDHPDLLLCTGQIERANELKGTVLHPGQSLRIPTDRASMLVDLDAHWAFYLLGDEIAAAWEIGVGKEGGTRPGSYTVGDKKEEPMWFRQGQAPVPFGDPQNPLGTRWIAWIGADGKTTGLGFHGTNAPESIGRDQSQGCIRMLNADVEQLFEILPKGAQILVQP